jgi:signal peptidase II
VYLSQLKKWLPLGLVGGFIILLDQFSKAWIINSFELGDGFEIFPPLLHVRRSMNTGIAFGIGEGGSTIYLLLSLMIVLVLLWVYRRSSVEAKVQHLALALVIGGALGNAIDRLQHGYVVDWVFVNIPNLVSNVSNFADHAIVLGVLILLLDGYVQERREKNMEKGKLEQSAETEVVSEV